MSVSCSKLRIGSDTIASDAESLPELTRSWWTPDSNAVDAGGARGCRRLSGGDSITPGSAANSKSVPWFVPVARALSGRHQDCLSARTALFLNEQPLVHDKLLRWHTQGHFLGRQTARNRLCAMALVALVEMTTSMEVQELLRVVVTRVI